MPLQAQNGKIWQRQMTVLDMCVRTHVMLAIPCKSPRRDLRDLAALGQTVRSQTAVSGIKGNGRMAEKTKNCQDPPRRAVTVLYLLLIDLSKKIVAEGKRKSKGLARI